MAPYDVGILILRPFQTLWTCCGG